VHGNLIWDWVSVSSSRGPMAMAESQNRWIMEADASSLPSPLHSTCPILDNQLGILDNPNMQSAWHIDHGCEQNLQWRSPHV